MARFGLDRRRVKRGELAGLGIKSELQHLIGAEIGRIDKAVRAIR